jgi:uncharacterized membrane protein YbhN (UPF0104 family)
MTNSKKLRFTVGAAILVNMLYIGVILLDFNKFNQAWKLITIVTWLILIVLYQVLYAKFKATASQ